MECVEAAALKTNSSLKEMSLKTTASQFDEFLSSNNVLNGAADDFFVDELFNFSNEDDNFVEVEEDFNRSNETQEQQRQHSTLENSNESPNSGFVLEDEFGCLPTSELCVPAEELESLEWLSHFVEDSFASFPVPAKPEVRREEEVVTPFKTPVPAKARSKRTRTGGRVWSLSSPTFTESSSSSSSSSSSPTSPFVIELVEKPGGKRQRRKSAVKSGPVQPRRCSHCGVQKTPQWRTGPLGAKTLCNACGVRYKSGRLLPEYRPACSPTFSSELHSNHHRKVLEMRKKKEVEVLVDAKVVTNVVPSFE